MPIVDQLKGLLTPGGSGVEVKRFECEDCGSTFESAKEPGRAQCSECLSKATTVVETGIRD